MGRWFGLANAIQATRVAFLMVAAWWAVFSVPVFLFVKEPQGAGRRRGLEAVRAGLAQLASTFRQIRRLKMVALFLAGYWLYIDGVDTVMRMAVDYGLSLGFEDSNLIVALLITQFVGFPAAIAFGRIGERIGTKTGIGIGIVAYLGVTVWGALMREVWEFYALAVTVGLVQGGVQTLSRSLYSRIIPPSQAAEFFGFYGMLGKFAAVIGPILMGWVALWSGSPRLGILSVAVLFVLGGALLWKVDEEEARRAVTALDEAP